jgi:Uma2 family endonuclease
MERQRGHHIGCTDARCDSDGVYCTGQEMAMVAPVKTMTPEEFLDLEDGVGYELVDGCPVERNVSIKSSEVGGQVLHLIKNSIDASGAGRVFPPDLGIRIFPNPRDVRKADVSFIRAARMPKEDSGYLEVASDLVVEVNSPNDLARRVRAKVQTWLNAGVGMVWVVEPEAKEVTVYRRGETPIVFTAESEITGGEIIPGFACKVARFFE